MTLNVILEIICTRIWCAMEEKTFRERKEGIGDIFFFLVLLFPILTDLGVFYSSTRPDLFTAVVRSLIKTFGCTLLILSRNLIFKTGIWASLVTLMFLDLGIGAAVILRYGVFRILGISVAQYEPGNFRLLPLLMVMAGFVFAHFTIVRWLHKYEKYMDRPNLLLKVIAAFYWLPSLVVVRPIDMIDIMGKKIAVIISSITGISVMVGGWICLILQQRKITKENHYLKLQTELFQEHNRVLNEQVEFIDQCKEYFQKEAGEAEEIDALKDRIADVQKSYDTGRELLDTVIENKEQRCLESGIRLEKDMKAFRLPPNISEIDFLTIFYNLFDNAMEAACQCEEPNRVIKVHSHFQQNELYFSIENGAIPRKRLKSGLFTTKEDPKNHGFGLRIVREIVEKNHGKLDFQEQKERFCVCVILPIEGWERMEERSCID